MDISIRVLDVPKYDDYNNQIVTIADQQKNISELKVWSEQHGQPEWRVGGVYFINSVKQHSENANSPRYEASSKSQFRLVGNSGSPEVSLIHVSDTHIGRPQTNKQHQGDENQLERFIDVVRFAIKYRVDAILHTGDIFDDDVSEEELEVVEESLELLRASDIPIYYVRGNHGCPPGDIILERYTEHGNMVHLSGKPEVLGEGSLALYGIDSDPQGGLSKNAPRDEPPHGVYRLLGWHEAVEPVAKKGTHIQNLIDTSAVELDAIALGDLHKCKRAPLFEMRRACNGTLRVFYAGATTKIAKFSDEYEPKAWLLQVTDGHLERYPLSFQ